MPGRARAALALLLVLGLRFLLGGDHRKVWSLVVVSPVAVVGVTSIVVPGVMAAMALATNSRGIRIPGEERLGRRRIHRLAGHDHPARRTGTVLLEQREDVRLELPTRIRQRERRAPDLDAVAEDPDPAVGAADQDRDRPLRRGPPAARRIADPDRLPDRRPGLIDRGEQARVRDGRRELGLRRRRPRSSPSWSRRTAASRLVRHADAAV